MALTLAISLFRDLMLAENWAYRLENDRGKTKVLYSVPCCLRSGLRKQRPVLFEGLINSVRSPVFDDKADHNSPEDYWDAP